MSKQFTRELSIKLRFHEEQEFDAEKGVTRLTTWVYGPQGKIVVVEEVPQEELAKGKKRATLARVREESTKRLVGFIEHRSAKPLLSQMAAEKAKAG